MGSESPLVARVLIAAGVVLVLAGLVVLLAAKIPWIGRLPGDIRIEGGRWTVYFPIATCLVASAILSILLALFLRR